MDALMPGCVFWGSGLTAGASAPNEGGGLWRRQQNVWRHVGYHFYKWRISEENMPFVADGVRFELTEGVNPRRFSRPVL